MRDSGNLKECIHAKANTHNDRANKLMRLVGISLLASSLWGCGNIQSGYANNSGGRALTAEMCESVRTFTRTTLDAEGLRRAWFLPFGVYEDGSFDFYAPMASSPNDDASADFYKQRVGQLTHYTSAPEFARALATCLTRRHGYTTVCHNQTNEGFRASLSDLQTGRSVEISSASDTTGILIAERGWAGNVEQALGPDHPACTPDR